MAEESPQGSVYIIAGTMPKTEGLATAWWPFPEALALAIGRAAKKVEFVSVCLESGVSLNILIFFVTNPLPPRLAFEFDE